MEISKKEILKTIEKEIRDICELSAMSGLEEKHIRSLQMLIKTRELLNGNTESPDDSEQLDMSPEEVTAALRELLHGEREEEQRLRLASRSGKVRGKTNQREIPSEDSPTQEDN